MSDALIRLCTGRRWRRWLLTGGTVLALTLLAAAVGLRPKTGGPDTDGDGLSDADETNLYLTNPSLADTDGDGMGDGDEIQAGTAPRNPASVFKFLAPPESLGNGVWRVRWSSVSGKVYRVERALTDDLNITNWLQLTQLTATASSALFEDRGGPSAHGFYRVQVEGVTIVETVPFQGDPLLWVPLDAQGQPLPSGRLNQNPDGSLPPFEYRPTGQSALGFGQGLAIRFPSGAQLVPGAGSNRIRFTSGFVTFGPKSPFQLRQSLGKGGGEAVELPAGDLSVAALLTAFGRPASEGLELRLWDKFDLRLRHGVFTPAGLREAKVELQEDSLPLPADTNVFSGFTLNLEPDGSIRIPLSGQFGFRETGGHGARLRVPPARPLWLELRADGGIGLGGRAELEFQPGPKFSVDFLMDDPNYELSMSARGLHLPMISSLDQLLPPAPIVPDSTNSLILSNTTAQLRCYQAALEHLSSVAIADTPYGEDENRRQPVDINPGPATLLAAWGITAECASLLDGSALTNALAHAGEMAAAARNLKAVLDLRIALLRIKHGFAIGGFAAHPAAQSQLDAALVTVTAAAVQRARTPESVNSLANFTTVMGCLLEQQKLEQQLGLTTLVPRRKSASGDALLQSAIEDLLRQFTQNFTDRLAVAPGAYIPAVASPIDQMSEAESFLTMTQAVQLVAWSQQLGLDTLVTAPLGETLAQLAYRVWVLASADLAGAEAVVDLEGFLEALRRTLRLITIVQSGIIPSAALGNLPGESTLNSLSSRLGAVMQADLDRQAAQSGGLAAPAKGAKIVRGEPAPDYIPYQVALFTPPYRTNLVDDQFCGGTIIGDRWVLTAAHCVTGTTRDEIGVLVGVTNLSTGHAERNHYGVRRIIIHPFYDNTTLDYDAALLELDSKIAFADLNQDGVERARIAALFSAAAGAKGFPALGVQALASGWGRTTPVNGTTPEALQIATLPISGRGLSPNLRTSRMILAGDLTSPLPASICEGDSGGPLAVGNILVGVSSFRTGNDCGTAGYPAGFARVSAFEFWIRHHAEGKQLNRSLRAISTLNNMPSEVLANTPAVRLLLQRAEAELAAANPRLGTMDWEELTYTLELGFQFARLRDRFHYDSPPWWEESLLGLVVFAMSDRAQSGAVTSRELFGPISKLLQQADYIDQHGGDQQVRKDHLSYAALLAQQASNGTKALVNDYRQRAGMSPLAVGRPKDGPVPEIVDMLLPGDIFIDRVAGSLRFNRHSRFLEGSFSGQMRLPKFNLALTVQNASINSQGAFDLNAFGQVGLGLPGNSVGTMSVSPRRPLHVAFTPPNRLVLEGGLRLALDNGMSFEGYGSLADPVYQFGVAASGIRLDLARNAFGYIPVLDQTKLRQLGPDLSGVLNNYFRDLSATAESLSSLTDPPQFAPLGEPPDFSDSVIVVNTDDLNAVANGLLFVLAAPAVAGYQTWEAARPVIQALVRDVERESERAARDLQRAREDFQTAAGDAKNEAREVLVRKLKEAAETANKISDTARAVAERQMAGDLPNEPGLNPADSPKVQEHDHQTREALKEASFAIPPRVRLEIELGLMQSMNSYLAERQGVGADVGDVQAALLPYVQNAKVAVFTDYGLDANGNVSDAAKFNALTDAQLSEALDLASELGAVGQRIDDPAANTFFQNVARKTLGRRHELLGAEIKNARERKYPAEGAADVDGLRQEALAELISKAGGLHAAMQKAGVDDLTLSAGYDGTPGARSGVQDFSALLEGLSESAGRRAGYLDPGSPQYSREYVLVVRKRIDAENLKKLKARELERRLQEAKARPAVPPSTLASLQSSLNALAARHMNLLDERLTSSGAFNFTLQQARAFGQELVGLAKLLEGTAPAALANPKSPAKGVNNPQLNAYCLRIFPACKVRITALADAQKAWWTLTRVNEVLLEGLAGKATNDFTTVEAVSFAAAKETLEAAQQILTVLRNDLALKNQPVDLPLPGDVVINRAYGDILYHRDTGYLRGSFGGRIEFPDLRNAYFEISRATLDNLLNFSIAAGTGGPLPFGGAWATAAVHASGGRNLPLDFRGTGTLSLSNAPDFAVDVGFNTGTRRLSFDTRATELQTWRPTDQLVFFNAGFGFTIDALNTNGELRVNGSAGMFPKTPIASNTVVTPGLFHLHAENVSAAVQLSLENARVVLSNGTLHLPPLFYPTNMATLCPGVPGPATGPSISLNPQNPIQATIGWAVPPALPPVSFSGEIDFRQFGFATPGLDGLAAAVCSARLKFADDVLPYLTNVNATLQIPLPRSTNHIDLLNGVFSLTGYPSGRIQLREDLTMLDIGGFQVIALGTGHSNCPAGSGLTIYPTTGFQQLPALTIDGAMKVQAPADMLTGVNGDAAFGVACGSLGLTNGSLPRLHVDTLAFGGTFHLGGAEGVIVSNALISFEGIENFIEPTPQHPFYARLGGSLVIPNGPIFTLSNAYFRFFDPDRLPRFSVSGLAVDATSFQLVQSLPAAVDKAQLTLKNPELELPDLLAPTNISLKMSAHVSIPPEDPFLAGRIDNIGLTVTPSGYLQIDSITGLGLEIAGLEIPPLEEIGGKLYIGGLADPQTGAPTPEKIYFAGRVAGSYNGYKLKMLMAFNLAGPIGLCGDLNAGAVGIPLDGYVLGGVLLTGASGGVSFLNNGQDPCSFTSYMNTNGQPVSTFIELPAVLSWGNLRTTIDRLKRVALAYQPPPPPTLNAVSRPKAAASIANNFDCPGDCPPATVNIFCQPHPDRERFPSRIIVKFSSIDEKTLNDTLQVTPENFQTLGANVAEVATTVAHKVRVFVESRVPPFNLAAMPPEKVAAMQNAARETFDAMEVVFSQSLSNALWSAGGDLYTVLRDTVHAGAPCPDITLMMSGTITHQVVSSFLSGTVGAVLSSSGNAGIMGNVNVLGVPVGKAKAFLAITDDRGEVNPSVCGELEFVAGPLNLGVLKAEMSCRDCISGVLREFGKFAQCLSEPVIRQVASNATPRLSLFNLPPEQLLTQMTPVEKAGFMAELYQLPPALLAGLPPCFLEKFGTAWASVQPYLVLCGHSEPKLFGIPLGGGLGEIAVEASKTNIAGVAEVSLSFMLLSLLDPRYAVLVRSIFPVEDPATLGFNLEFPDPGQALLAGLSGKLSSPAALGSYAKEQFDYMLEHAVYTMQYELRPIGGKGLDSQARVIMPNLTNHPARPNSAWQLPEQRGSNYPTREDLLFALLATNKLADPFWTGEDLGEIDGRLAGLSLRKDYFPHGGILGAAKLMMPKALTDRPPDYLPALLNPQSSMSPVDRLLNALDYVQNYLLNFNERGSLSFYAPAPNPPFFTNSAGANLGPQDLLAAISSFDFKSMTNAQVAALYPSELFFIKGYYNATLLGVPMSTGILVALPPAPLEGRPEAVFRLEVAATPQGWLTNFVTTNNLIFDLKSAPPRPMEAWANEVFLELSGLLFDPGATEQQLLQTANDFASSLQTNLPKVRLEADLQFQTPPPMRDVLTVDGTTRLHAYSPKFDPGYEPTNNSPMARIKREGGIAFQGSARLKVGPVELAHVANAEFSLVPAGDGIPDIAARLDVPVIAFPPDLPVLTFRDVAVDFANAPQARFHGAGTLDSLSVGSFQFGAQEGFQFGGSLDVVSRGNNQADIGFTINPATILLGGYGERLLVHGATRNEPFTFSTSGPWTASLELTNDLNLLNVVRLGYGGMLAPVTLNGLGTGSASFTVGMGPGAGLTLFPANAALRRDLTIGAGVTGTATVGSDGRFLFRAQLGGESLNINGVGIPAGASLVASNEGVAFTWQVGNSTASLGVATNGTVSVNGSMELPPLDFGVFRLSGAGGGNLTGAFNNDGFAVDSGAELRLNAGPLGQQVLTLNTFTYSNSGAMAVSANLPPGGLLFAGYPFEPTSLSFTRTATNLGSVASLGLSARVKSIGNFAHWPTLPLTGSVSSAGAVFLSASTAGPGNFYGFPIVNFTNWFNLPAGSFLADFGLKFSLGNNALPLWDKLGTNQFSGQVDADGSFALDASSGSLLLALFPIQNSTFRMTRAAGQLPSVSVAGTFGPPGWSALNLSGLIASNGAFSLGLTAPAPGKPLPYGFLSANVSVLLTNTGMTAAGTLHQAPLPSLTVTGTVTTAGAYTLIGTIPSSTTAGFPFNNVSVTLQGSGTTPGYVAANGTANLGLLGNINLSGGYTNESNWGLATAQSFNLIPLGLPVSSFSAGSTLRWNPGSLSITGAVSGGLISSLGAAANARLDVTPGPAFALSGNFGLPSLSSGQLTIQNPGGGNISASFNNSGITATGAELRLNNSLLAALPAFTITNGGGGDFSFTVGTPAPVTLTLGGFTLNNATLTLRRTAGVLFVDNVAGQLVIPGLNTVAQVQGSLGNNGSYSFGGGIGGAVPVVGLPVTQLGANATVAWDNINGLRVTGSVSGSLFDTVGQAGATGTFHIQANGAMKLGGSVTIPSLALGALAITNLGLPNISLTLTNDGLVFPGNLRLMFNGAVFPDFTLPSFTNDANGNATFRVTGQTLRLAGFTNSNASFTFVRTGDSATVTLTAGTLTVPGLPGLSAGISGTLSSSGQYSLQTSAGLAGSFTPALGNSFGTISGITGITLDNSSLRVSGSLAGNALGFLNAGVTASGLLTVASNGSITPAATFNLGELLLADKVNGFHLAPSGGGSFSLTLGPSGVTFPAGAQMFYRNSALGSFALPAFTVPANGNFSVSFGPASLALEGFSINASGSLARNGSTTILTLSGGTTLPLPGLNTTISATGSLTNNGTFLIANNAAGTLALPNLPITSLASAVVSLGRVSGSTSFRVTGNASGGMLGAGGSDLRLVNSSVTLTLNTFGPPTLNAAINLQPFTTSFLTVEGNANGASIGGTLSNSGLFLTGARVRMTLAGVLNVPINLPPLSIPASGAFDMPLGSALPSLNIQGFPFNNVNLNLRRFSSGDLRLHNISGTLGLGGFGQPFSGGTILADGSVLLDWSGSLNLAGFGTGAGGYLRLRNTGMSAGGDFNLTAAGRTFHSSASFAGSVFTSGRFSLTGTMSLSIGNLEMPDATLTLTNTGVIGLPTLRFGDPSGKLEFSPSDFILTSVSGVSFSRDIPLVNASLSIFGSPSLASANFTARLASDGTSGSVRVLGSVTVGGDTWNLAGGVNVDSSLEFERTFFTPGPLCVRFDLAPLRAKVCGTSWP